MNGLATGAADFESGEIGQGIEMTLDHTWPWPPWVALLALIVLSLVVVTIYLREAPQTTSSMRLALAAFRITLFALVIFMMHGWVQHRHRTDLPDLVILLDDSRSMSVEDRAGPSRSRSRMQRAVTAAGFDGPSRFNWARWLLLGERSAWLTSLSDRYHVRLYLIGETARPVSAGTELESQLRAVRPEGDASRLGKCLRDVFAAQRGRPTAAVVILTDGISTEGPTLSETAQLARREAVPLFVVGIGNAAPPKDVRLSELVVDDVVFLDDLVSFDFQLHSDGYEGRQVVVRLQRTDLDRVLAQQVLPLPADGVAQPVRLSIRPQAEGDFEYVVDVKPLKGEVNYENNRLSQRIQVRNAAVRVLLVQSYPNYEFRFLKNLLGRLVSREGSGERLVELTSVLLDADLDYSRQDADAARVFPVSAEQLNAYDVLIVGDVNPASLGRAVMANITRFAEERGGGVVFLAGPTYTPLAYAGTPLARLLALDLDTATVPAHDAVLQTEYPVTLTPLGRETPHLQLGETPEQTVAIWEALPGLRWVLDAGQLPPAARVLVELSGPGTGGRGSPVVWMQFAGAGKVVFHATDETYRWSRWGGDDSYYARYWLQTLRYLSRAKLLSESQPAVITTDRQEYRQGEPVRVAVRFHDERLAPASDDGVQVVIESDGGRRRQVRLKRTLTRRGVFSAVINDLEVGDYRVWLVAKGAQARPPSQAFAVRPPFGEQLRLEMDAEDLGEAARVSRGRFYTSDRTARLPKDLPRGRQVRVESLPPEPIWNSSLLVAVFLGLVTAEWILRKRVGMI